MTMTILKLCQLYDQDYHLWLETTIGKLRQEQFSTIDLDNLIEELETLGRSEQKALRSHLRLILLHLLKWQHQLEKRSKSWQITIRNNRLDVEEALQDSPSLKAKLSLIIAQVYPRAVIEAADETDLPPSCFPQTCPFSPEQILDLGFFP